MIKEMRPVIKMDLDGNFIAEFESITKAAKSVSAKRTAITHIRRVCCISEKYSKTALGFKWKYKS